MWSALCFEILRMVSYFILTLVSYFYIIRWRRVKFVSIKISSDIYICCASSLSFMYFTSDVIATVMCFGDQYLIFQRSLLGVFPVFKKLMCSFLLQMKKVLLSWLSVYLAASTIIFIPDNELVGCKWINWITCSVYWCGNPWNISQFQRLWSVHDRNWFKWILSVWRKASVMCSYP